jgi:hypothetical protein
LLPAGISSEDSPLFAAAVKIHGCLDQQRQRLPNPNVIAAFNRTKKGKQVGPRIAERCDGAKRNLKRCLAVDD